MMWEGGDGDDADHSIANMYVEACELNARRAYTESSLVSFVNIYNCQLLSVFYLFTMSYKPPRNARTILPNHVYHLTWPRYMCAWQVFKILVWTLEHA